MAKEQHGESGFHYHPQDRSESSRACCYEDEECDETAFVNSDGRGWFDAVRDET